MSTQPSPDLGGPAGGPASPPETPGIWVRATIPLPGLGRDELAYVNPLDPEVRLHLNATFLVPLPGQNWQELEQQLPDPADPAPPADVHDPG